MDNMQTVPRLIKSFVPKNYKLFLSLNRTKRFFYGNVIISGKLLKNNNEIILHSKDLDIESVLCDDSPAEFSFGDNDSLVINNINLKNGPHILKISFNGKITDAMHGMYPCYFDHNGLKKELLATQFESHHAREVFPCIDEPEAKATFDVTLETENNIQVLGNMPVKEQSRKTGHLITTFETTPIISSYLLAWVVGELHKKTAYTKNGVEVNAWATPAQPDTSLDFALDIAIRSIDFFENYFGTNYPLSKCDNVALPDFSSGAMENWGLITYREIAMLADPKTTSISSKQYAATVIAHELSHQWFGNLVTMKWWNDLWLNESFATFIEYLAVDSIEPNWNIWLDFASYECAAALRRDSLAGVQPVQTDVNHPDEINTLFDGAIVYAKGARLIKMLQHYVGNDNFRAGLKKYFNKFAYKNTEAIDLWQTLTEVSNKDIENFMTKWITQPGFPVLHASRVGNQINLSQERLSSSPNKNDAPLWPIILNSNYPEMPEVFNGRDLTITVSGDQPIRFNIGNNSHFITHYDLDLLMKLIKEIQSNNLTQLDRLQLLNEQIILANAGIISSAELVPLLGAYKNESVEAVWSIIGMTIGELKKFVEDNEEAEQKLRQFAGTLAKNQFKKLGWTPKKNESEAETKLRSIIIGLMLYSEDKTVIDYADELFRSVSIDKLDPELRGLIISSVIRHKNDITTIRSLLKKYEKTASSELRMDINVGLAATKDAKIINLLLDTLKDTSVIRTQDTARWIAYLIRNKFARDQTWRWLCDNWDWIDSTFGGDKSYDDYPRYAAMALSSRKQLDEYIKFFKPKRSDPSLTRVIDMGINEITNRIKIIEKDAALVRKALLDL
jgi:aminopeptidase N